MQGGSSDTSVAAHASYNSYDGYEADNYVDSSNAYESRDTSATNDKKQNDKPIKSFQGVEITKSSLKASK